MIAELKNIPDNIAGFRASGEVTAEDFKNIVLPVVNDVINRTGKLNYIMVIETPLRNFTIGAWWQDALLGLKKSAHWERVAILAESEEIKKFTDAFSYISPGEFKGFAIDELAKAVAWIEEK
jgi:hypothetical protein